MTHRGKLFRYEHLLANNDPQLFLYRITYTHFKTRNTLTLRNKYRNRKQHYAWVSSPAPESSFPFDPAWVLGVPLFSLPLVLLLTTG